MRVSCRLTVGWKSGVVKNDSFLIIRVDTLCENCSTCFRIYRRKASLDQRPIIMIVKVGTSARYIAIAAPDRTECVPMSSGLNPSLSSPSDLAADLSLVSIVDAEIVASLSFTRMVFTVDDSSVLG